MLDFINNNGVLFSGIFSIIVALISVLVTVIRDHKKSRVDTVKSLRKELENTKKELDEVRAEIISSKSVETAEKQIDKSHGSIYYETLPNGSTRHICGFCWEKEHIRIPIVVDICYEEYSKQSYYDGYCNSCKSHCIENIDAIVTELSGAAEEDLPF